MSINHDIETKQFGIEYADKHLKALDLSLHFGLFNLSTSSSEDFKVESERLADKCLSLQLKSERALSRYLTKLDVSRPSNDRLVICPTWWSKQLYKQRRVAIAHVARAVGLVSKVASFYIDQVSIETYQRIRIENRAFLEENYLSNNQGQSMSLAELSDASISNPVHRRAEMMTHLRGLSDWAEAKGYLATFVTLTAPSRMHRISTGGMRNPAYDGSPVTYIQQYLQQVWSRTRAKFERDNIAIYGMRVVEPHHDGCPHWHLMIFTKPHHQTQMQTIFRDYALQDSPDEKGAQEHRIKFENCDYSKGSPVGYMAKYVSKNIDGHGLETDDYGNPISSATENILAWSRTYRIRQFQFFGIPPRTIWRELRRVKTPFSDQDLENLRIAADTADFKRYIEFYRKLTPEQTSRPIKIVRISTSIDPETGEVLQGSLLDADLSYLHFRDKYFRTQQNAWTKTSPPDSSMQLESFPFLSVAEDGKSRLHRDQVASLGLVSITVRKDHLSPNNNPKANPPDRN